MVELLATIILISSLFGMAVILFREIPILVEFPENTKGPQKKFFLKLRERILSLFSKRSFSFEMFLQKLLSKIRILTLRTDQKTSLWLQKLRERAQKSRLKKIDNYWEELKKSQKSKKLKTGHNLPE